MKHERRGKALIYNHSKFNRLPKGSNSDLLKKTFKKQLGFEITFHNFQSFHDIKELFPSGKYTMEQEFSIFVASFNLVLLNIIVLIVT